MASLFLAAFSSERWYGSPTDASPTLCAGHVAHDFQARDIRDFEWKLIRKLATLLLLLSERLSY
uniref:Uncharacterized protein n=1 Tax=Peronospora matthiolae TaxID=2874970 RepID=A0AAV1VNH3_9STRA